MKGTLRASLAMTAGALALALAVPSTTLAAEDWYPFPVEVWDQCATQGGGALVADHAA